MTIISKAVTLLSAPTQDLFILEQEYPNVYVSVWLFCSTKLPSERVTATQPLNSLPHLIVKAFFFVPLLCALPDSVVHKKQPGWKIVRCGASGGGVPSLLSLDRIAIYNQLSFVNFNLTIGQMWNWTRCYWQILLWNSTIHLYKTLRRFLRLFTTLFFFVFCLKHLKAGKLRFLCHGKYGYVCSLQMCLSKAFRSSNGRTKMGEKCQLMRNKLWIWCIKENMELAFRVEGRFTDLFILEDRYGG